MAQFQFSFWSKQIGDQVHVNILLPIGTIYEPAVRIGERFETLWLLHGAGGNAEEWTRMTDIERISQNHKRAVVMPEIWGNYYADIVQGPQYFRYITEELPAFLRKYFPLSELPEDNYICGISMGGYGAAKTVFRYPERYGAAGFFSCGPFTPEVEQPVPEHLRKRLQNIFGDLSAMQMSENDVMYLLHKSLKEGKTIPPLFNSCGRQDPSYARFEEFRRAAETLPLSVTYDEVDGMHDWDYWTDALHRWIDWLPLKNRNFRRRYTEERMGK